MANVVSRRAVLGRRGAALWTVLLALTPLAAVHAQTSPFLTGMSSLQTNILSWLTPIAIILVMVMGAMAMANRVAQVSGTYGPADAQTIVENCGSTLILRCSGSEHGGTAAFASRLIGDREILRLAGTRERGASGPRRNPFGAGFGRSVGQRSLEAAVLPAEIEQLPDRSGYLKVASAPHWTAVRF